MANLASTYRNQGRWEEAEKLGAQVMEMRKRVLGPEHPSALTSRESLAYTWISLGKAQDALYLIEVCLELKTKALGPDHPHTMPSSDTLSEWKQGEDSISSKRPQAPVQADSGQYPQRIPTAVLLTKLNNEELVDPSYRQNRSITPTKQFLEKHPLLLALRSISPMPQDHSLQEVG
jgi:hypothetical protein